MIFFLLIVLVCIVCSLDVGMGVPVQQVSNFQLLVGLVSVFVFLFLINEITEKVIEFNRKNEASHHASISSHVSL